MVNFIAWILVGGLLGWSASKLMGAGTSRDVAFNIVVGIVGAFVAALVLTPFFGTMISIQNNFSFHAMLVSLLGAFALLTLRTFLRGGAYR